MSSILADLTQAFFACSVLHALDHVCLTRVVGHVDMQAEELPNHSWFNLFQLMFGRPSQYFWTNLLKDKVHKHTFYRDLYAELSAIDRELADEVTLSIAY